MKIKFIFVLLNLLGFSLNARNKLETLNSVFQYDSSLTIKFYSLDFNDEFFIVSKLYFNDSLFYTSKLEDTYIFGETSTNVETIIDSLVLDRFTNYFLLKYNIQPDFQSLPQSIFYLEEYFGLATGPSGEPSKVGLEFLEFQKIEHSSETIKAMFLSFNPRFQLYGALLYNPEKHFIDPMIVSNVMDSKYIYNYKYGCSGYESSSIKEIINSVNKIQKKN